MATDTQPRADRRPMTGEPIHKVQVERVDKIADAVVTLSLVSLDEDTLPSWEPGAHIDLCLTDDLVRQYSLCGSPKDQRRWQIAVLHTPDSRGGSAAVHTRIQPGDVLPVRGPRNNFPLVPARHYLFIAGGIGITPLLPMIEAVREQPGVEWRLAYGGRSRSTMAFLPELEQFGEQIEIVSEDDAGLLDLDRLLGEPRIGVAIYACGPEALLTELERRCRSWPPGTLHVERFRHDTSAEDSSADAIFQVVAEKSGIAVDVPPDTTIVEALEEHDIYVPVSCGEGVCGTCITRVIEGEPVHRDAVLTEEEQASCEWITPCCSRSRTPRMILDL